MENEEKVVAALFKLPSHLEEALSAEAVRERRSRQGQLIRILEERYAPAVIAEKVAEEVGA